MKNIPIHCVLLLACTAVCASTVILRCQCLTTSAAVRPSLVVDVRVYGPRPYCSQTEVIVTLRGGRLLCLNPRRRLTQAIVQRIQLEKAARAGKMRSTSGPQRQRQH